MPAHLPPLTPEEIARNQREVESLPENVGEAKNEPEEQPYQFKKYPIEEINQKNSENQDQPVSPIVAQNDPLSKGPDTFMKNVNAFISYFLIAYGPRFQQNFPRG